MGAVPPFSLAFRKHHFLGILETDFRVPKILNPHLACIGGVCGSSSIRLTCRKRGEMNSIRIVQKLRNIQIVILRELELKGKKQVTKRQIYGTATCVILSPSVYKRGSLATDKLSGPVSCSQCCLNIAQIFSPRAGALRVAHSDHRTKHYHALRSVLISILRTQVHL